MYTPIEKEAFHVHTFRCRHASMDTDESYVLKAISLGIKRIVFTDHVPFLDKDIPYQERISPKRMRYSEMEGYLSSINDLKEKYEDKIQIMSGFECEYRSDLEGYYSELKDRVDVLLLGQHFYQRPDNAYTYTSDGLNYIDVYESLIKGANSGLFDVIAHPDRIMAKCDELVPAEKGLISSLINEVIKRGMYLEKNISSVIRNNFKPSFWQYIPKEVKTLKGLDAHSVEQLEHYYNNLNCYELLEL